MTRDEFESRYRLVERLTERGVETHRALEPNGGTVLVHFIGDTGCLPKGVHFDPSVLTDADAGAFLAVLEVADAAVVVTREIEGLRRFEDWIGSALARTLLADARPPTSSPLPHGHMDSAPPAAPVGHQPTGVYTRLMRQSDLVGSSAEGGPSRAGAEPSGSPSPPEAPTDPPRVFPSPTAPPPAPPASPPDDVAGAEPATPPAVPAPMGNEPPAKPDDAVPPPVHTPPAGGVERTGVYTRIMRRSDLIPTAWGDSDATSRGAAPGSQAPSAGPPVPGAPPRGPVLGAPPAGPPPTSAPVEGPPSAGPPMEGAAPPAPADRDASGPPPAQPETGGGSSGVYTRIMRRSDLRESSGPGPTRSPPTRDPRAAGPGASRELFGPAGGDTGGPGGPPPAPDQRSGSSGYGPAQPGVPLSERPYRLFDSEPPPASDGASGAHRTPYRDTQRADADAYQARGDDYLQNLRGEVPGSGPPQPPAPLPYPQPSLLPEPTGPSEYTMIVKGGVTHGPRPGATPPAAPPPAAAPPAGAPGRAGPRRTPIVIGLVLAVVALIVLLVVLAARAA